MRNVTSKNKVWIDLENSPHVVFFAPIIHMLQQRGCDVVITARDCFQVRELADMYGLSYKLIGRHYGKSMFLKVCGLIIRCLQCRWIHLLEKPTLAVSHGSRTQMLTAAISKIPFIVIFDYEHASWTPFLTPIAIIKPEVIPQDAVKKKTRIVEYSGIKEDVYLPFFAPDSRIMDELGLQGGQIKVVIRPPAVKAHYHNRESERLLEVLVEFLGPKADVKMILLPRDDEQKRTITEKWPKWTSNGRILIPDHVVDGLNLIWHADLVVSGGGTMTREAAALGVPVYSIFRGKIGAVDRHLAESDRLTLLRSPEDVRTKIRLKHHERPPMPQHTNNGALAKIVDSILDFMEN